MNFGVNTARICNFVHNCSKNLQIKPKLSYMDVKQPNASQRALSKKLAFWRKLVKNWILEPFIVKFRGRMNYFQVWGSFQQAIQ